MKPTIEQLQADLALVESCIKHERETERRGLRSHRLADYAAERERLERQIAIEREPKDGAFQLASKLQGANSLDLVLMARIIRENAELLTADVIRQRDLALVVCRRFLDYGDTGEGIGDQAREAVEAAQ